MSFRTTIVLLVFMFLLGGYVYYQMTKPPTPQPEQPWFYQIDMNRISLIKIEHRGQQASFYKDDKQWWRYGAPNGPEVDEKRWGGIVLLLSGPKSKRVFAEKVEDLTPFGLDKPSTKITVGLEGGAILDLALGEKTRDGQNNYAKLLGFDPVYLVDYSWGEVLTNLVTQPPLPPPPTPTFAPSSLTPGATPSS